MVSILVSDKVQRYFGNLMPPIITPPSPGRGSARTGHGLLMLEVDGGQSGQIIGVCTDPDGPGSVSPNLIIRFVSTADIDLDEVIVGSEGGLQLVE